MDITCSGTINVLIRLLLATCCICQGILVGHAEEPVAPEEVSLGVLRAGLQKTQLRTLALEEALQIALEQNPAIHVAASARKQAKAQYWGRLADFLPDVGVAYNISSYNGMVQGRNSTLIPVKQTTHAPQLYFKFNMLQGGAPIFLARYAKRTLEAQQLSEQATTQEVLYETALRYYDMERALADLKAAQTQVRETQENLEAVQSRGVSEGVSSLDALQLEAQMIEARERLVTAESESQQAAARLNELLALPAFVEALPQNEQAVHTLIPAEVDFQGCLAQSHTDNPRLKALNKQLLAMQQLLRGAKMTGILPEGSLEFNLGGVGASRQELGSYQSQAARIGVVSRNMGMDSLARYREFKAQMAGLKSEIAALKNELQRTVSEAHIQAQARHTQINIVRQRAIVGGQTRQTALAGIKAGQASGLDVIRAQDMLNNARYQLNENILSYNRAQADLMYAMGMVSVATLTRGLPSQSTEVSSNHD